MCAIADKFNEGLRQEVFDYIALHTKSCSRRAADAGAGGRRRAEPDDETVARSSGCVYGTEYRPGGLRALRPLLHFSRNDLWEMQMLGASAPKRGRRRKQDQHDG